MFLLIAIVLISIAYFSMPAYLISSVVLYLALQIMGVGVGKEGKNRQIRHAGLIAWLISIPFSLVMVYLQRPV